MTSNFNLPPGVTARDVEGPEDKELARDIAAEKADHQGDIEREDA